MQYHFLNFLYCTVFPDGIYNRGERCPLYSVRNFPGAAALRTGADDSGGRGVIIKKNGWYGSGLYGSGLQPE